MEPMIRLLLVDDHPLFRWGVAELLRSTNKVEIAGQASNGEEAIRKARELKPDVILMDIQMPVCNGVDAVRYLREEGFTGAIIMLTVSETDADLFLALENGANGYLLKNTEVEELIGAILHAARGETVISPAMATRLIGEIKSIHHHQSETPHADILSAREEDILKLVAGGATNKEIAGNLFITENTVKCHMRNIMSKLNFKSRYQVVTYAVKHGLAPA